MNKKKFEEVITSSVVLVIGVCLIALVVTGTVAIIDRLWP